MTARLLPCSLEPQLTTTSLLSQYFSSNLFSRKPTKVNSLRRENLQEASVPNVEMLLGALLESLPQGIIVVSRDIKPIYLNTKASALCQLLMEGDRRLVGLPLAVSEICHRLIKGGSSEDRPLVIECQTSQGQMIRIQANWLAVGSQIPANFSASDCQPILVTLENCTEALQEELRIEQKKYDLTERETEIWTLLRQEYTYQEIAEALRISLNTVKTHVKNVYAKKRSCQGQEKVVVF